MDPIVTLLLKNGAFGAIAAIVFWLYIKERKINQEYADTYLEQQVEDTKSKVKLTNTLEQLTHNISILDNNISSELQKTNSMLQNLCEDMAVEKEVKRRESSTNPRIRSGE